MKRVWETGEVLVGKSEVKRKSETHSRGWEDNIKMYIQVKLGREGVAWDRDKIWTAVETVVKHRVGFGLAQKLSASRGPG